MFIILAYIVYKLQIFKGEKKTRIPRFYIFHLLVRTAINFV